MKRGDIVCGMVERLDFPNKGIVRINDDHILNVKNVIPGQKVNVRIKKLRSGKSEGSLVEVLQKSKEEVEPECPHFGICGGCAYQNLPYDKQLKLKEGQVKRLLDTVLKNGGYEWLGIKGSPVNTNYRNKMEFTFGDEYLKGPLSLGLHRRGSFYDVVKVENCRICDEDYSVILKETLNYFKSRNISYYHRIRHEGYLRHLLIRKAAYTEEILVALITTTQLVLDLSNYKDMLLELPLKGKITGIIHTKNDSLADIVQSDKTDILYGRDYITENLLGMKFKISAFSFFQTNTKGAELLYETAREFVGELGKEEKIVYDLYSGTGTIAQIMSPAAKKVIGVEIVGEAVEAARENTKLNGIDNCEFIAGDVLKVLDEIDEKPGLIILDPPRDGVHPKALRKIIDYGVERILYISCKPTSLVRDLEILTGNGYAVLKVVAVDQFPGTGHVETVVLLSKLNVDKHISVEIELDELDLTSAESKATYEQIKEYVLEKFGFKVSTLYIAQVKKKCGIELRKNYNKSKKEKQVIPQCTPEKEDAIMDALRHFKMI